MAKAKKITASKETWDKVFVVSGEPCMVRLTVSSLFEPSDRAKKFYKVDDISNLISALTVHGIRKTKVVVYEPNAEVLHVCLDMIEANRLACLALIVVVPGDGLDGRLSFYQRAQKNGRVFSHPYVTTEDAQILLKFMSGWQKDSGIEISGDAKKWILSHAPTMSVKIKSGSTKKDAEAYNLDLIDSELNKMISYCQQNHIDISVDMLREFCDFSQVADVWEFVRAAVLGDYKTMSLLWSRVIDEQSAMGLLYLLNSQMTFLIQLKELLLKGITDLSTIQERISCGRFLNKYVDEDWQEIECSTDSQLNPWRIKKAMETLFDPNCTLSNLMSKGQAVVNAIIDMRYGGAEDIILPYLVLSLASITRYSSPLYEY
jgi:hypothetical protein